MPRNLSLPLLTCDLCSLTTRNAFIFKRHRQRCMRDKGVPSQRWLSAQKVRGQRHEGDEDAEKGQEGDDAHEEDTEGAVIAEGDEQGSRAKSKSTSGGKTTPLSSEGKMTSRLRGRSSSDVDASNTEGDAEGPAEMDTETAEQDEEGWATLPKLPSNLPPPSTCRHYTCGHCDFSTNKSKEFLYHKIEQHKMRIHVFSCTFCEYASQYKHKLARHMHHAHNKTLSNEEIFPEYSRPAYTAGAIRSKLAWVPAHQRKGLKRKKLVSSKAAPKTSQSLESLLVKLRSKSKVTDANLSAFFTVTSGRSSDEGGEGEVFKCRLCLFTAKSRNKVLRHLQACHVNARPFRCNLCSYKTHSKIEFYAHKKKHTNKNTTMFKCSECAYATEFRPNFDRHMLQHGCNKPNRCSLCSYATDHEGALKRHVTSHHPNTAENQSLVIAGDESTLVCQNDEDEDDNSMEDNEGDEEFDIDGFKCPICSLQYRRCSDLNRHMKTKHKVSRKEFMEYSGDLDEEILEVDDADLADMDVEEVTDSEDSEESQPLSELCSKDQPVTKKINKKCSYCSYIAKWPSDLRRHMRVHSVVKRFKCSMCWKKYKYLGDLNVHLRRDHEVNPEQHLSVPQKVSTIAVKKNSPRLFRCPACPFFTKVKVDMDRHSHEHTEAKTYSCKLCRYETYWRGDMGRHLYRKHASDVAKDADLKQFFVFRPERRAISKGGTGVAGSGKAPESDSTAEDESPVKQPIAQPAQPAQSSESTAKPEECYEDSVSDTQSISDSLSNCSETTWDKDGNRLYRCQLCPFSNTQAHKMKNHMDTHLNLKQFKCPVCGQRGNWKYDIRKHIAAKHPGCGLDVITLSVEEAKATIQEYLLTRPNIKRDHHLNLAIGTSSPLSIKSASTLSMQTLTRPPLPQKKKVVEYKCSHCSFQSRNRLNINSHQLSSHAGEQGLAVLAKSIYVPIEDEDAKEEHDEESKEKPVARNQGRAEEEETQEAVSEKFAVDDDEIQEGMANMYRCAECGKQGVSKGAIKKHYNYIHPNSEVRIFSVADGVEFNYYTGLPTKEPRTPVKEPEAGGVDKAFLASKLSDPKKHGYVKPFQCSVCKQRSNWKWDIKKHLRVKHPGEFGYVIVLHPDQARATFPEKPSPAKESDSGTTSEGAISPEKASGDSRANLSSEMPYKSQEMLLGRYRRYKCSGCGYRSNWRTDICRHIERRHKDGNSEVIFMGVEEARETFMDYHYNPPNVNPHTPGASLSSSPQKRSSEEFQFKLPSPAKSPAKVVKKQPVSVTGKVWHCPKCPFVSALKSHIVSHMQNHGMKPFHCTACGMTSRFRSPIYRHIRKQHNSTNYNQYAKIIIKFSKPLGAAGVSPGLGVSPGRTVREARMVEAYLCRLCAGNTVETASKEEMLAHILSEHGSTDASQALKIKKKVGGEGREGDGSGLRAKRYLCTVCPYRTDKRGMLTFHHTYHQPSLQNKFKCKYCPYYVCASRLLHQHMSLHQEFSEDQATKESWRVVMEKTPPSSPTKRGKVSAEGGAKRHNCEKCPYTTNSKNDFLYHKQFHRPKPAAEYKCEHCDYWVTHRRLLKQHMRLHGEDYTEESVASSPTKSLASDASAVLDAVEIAAIKQKMIANKITASLSTSPAVSPMKIATQCTAGNRPGFVMRNGMYRKLHQCSKCPYTNIRSRNVRLHELMHGYRESENPLNKCPYCDYYVGAKGLLSHHLKVHNQRYQPDPSDSTIFDMEKKEHAPGVSVISAEPDEDNQGYVFASPQIPQRYKVDTLLEISRFKKYSCEKCPYASGKRSHFLRHMELHGSKQRHTCQYCDYSVPSTTLLMQHQRIHLMPNQNLLATQSFSNLQHLKEVPADVALASALPPTDSCEAVTISVIHDHLELYENDDTNALDAPPRKLYRCDRCPYANVRRDHLLTHLRFHLSKSTFHCPYCDYSAPKQQLLTQHIRVHFCPLPELSEWLIENGQSERAQEVNDLDLTQALEVAEKYQRSSKRKMNSTMPENGGVAADANGSKNTPASKKPRTEVDGDAGKDEISKTSNNSSNKTSPTANTKTANSEPQPSTSVAADNSDKPRLEKDGEKGVDESNMYICQYCDREFPSSKPLIAHEMQHLIGNHFEFSDDESSPVPAQSGPTQTSPKAEKDHQHVATATTPAGRDEEAMDTDSPGKCTQVAETQQDLSGNELNGKEGKGPVDDAKDGDGDEKMKAGDRKKEEEEEDMGEKMEIGAEGEESKKWEEKKAKEEAEKDKEEEAKKEKKEEGGKMRDVGGKEDGQEREVKKEKEVGGEGEEREKKDAGGERKEEEGKELDDNRGPDRRYMMRRRLETNGTSPSMPGSSTVPSQNGDK